MLPKETILVTGASGFIGGWIAETLYLQNSAQVRAGIRSWSSAARLGRFPIEIVPCDVLDEAQIAKAINDVDIVIHCAIGTRHVTVQGTNQMLDAALKQRVKRFVYISTAEVYGDVSGHVDETFPLQAMGREYGDSKIEAEEICVEYYNQGLPLTIIRPPIVYGPFGEDFTIKIAQKLQSGNWGIFSGFGEGQCNLVYVSDLVSAILLAARDERAVGQAFNINGSETISWNDYFQRFNAALGLPPLKTISTGTSRGRAMFMDPLRTTAKLLIQRYGAPIRSAYQRFREVRQIMQFLESSIRTTAAANELSLYNRTALYVDDKAKEVLGYRPQCDVATGLALSVEWLRQLGFLEHSGDAS
jgi:nucleoside-diphosphate-sugar epimerase